jgi:hypothetical protein
MISNHRSEHEAICDSMPWYVNGTLAEADRQKVDAHVRSCAACREELANEQRLYRAMAEGARLEYMPTASFKRLQATLDAPPPEGAAVGSGARARIPRWMPGLAAASVAVAVIALGVISARIHWGRRDLPAEYHTVTSATPRPPDEMIRAVFSPTITLVDLQAILSEAQLRIVSGPTEAGVYSLAGTSHRPAAASLELLRRHPSVRFAELTRPGASAGAGASP